jgi:aspartyl-tRNA(Asn)/glutamyl-tRNA(Gln) amidotransferase subunit B
LILAHNPYNLEHMTYEPTIGLEIHSELKTRTKMFCDSLNDPDEKHPNINVCPVCLGHPGTLPVINKKAVEEVIRVGLALSGEIPEFTKFDRKNYFYPDLPKGYQISQYDKPLVKGGELNGVRLERIHLEEDAGKLIHSESGDSLVDFNRAGVPLMELVTKPDIKSAEQAVEFAKELQLILKYLGASDADLEKGQMRADVNVSVAPKGELGTKVEIKNVNSFRSIAGAVKFEIERQRELLEKGEKIKQETRGWDDIKHKTVSQRSKEESHDYRYFPEPDLPPLKPAEAFELEKMKDELPELPAEKRERFAREFGFNEKQIEVLINNKEIADFFETASSELSIKTKAPQGNELLYNYIATDLQGTVTIVGVPFAEVRKKITPEHMADLINLLLEKKITTRQAKDILKIMFDSGESPENILGQGNFNLIQEEVLHQAVEEALHENPKAVADFASGKDTTLQFLVGQVMKKTKGGADPGEIQNKLLEKLKG